MAKAGKTYGTASSDRNLVQNLFANVASRPAKTEGRGACQPDPGPPVVCDICILAGAQVWPSGLPTSAGVRNRKSFHPGPEMEGSLRHPRSGRLREAKHPDLNAFCIRAGGQGAEQLSEDQRAQCLLWPSLQRDFQRPAEGHSLERGL